MTRGLALWAGGLATLALLVGAVTPALAEPEAKPQADGLVFTDLLPAEPKAIVSAFLKDHTLWNSYALKLSEQNADLAPAREAFRRLINLYCGPRGEFYSIYFHKDLHLTGDRSKIVGDRDEDERRIVEVRHEDDGGFVTLHNFVFVQSDAGWLLDEAYIYDHFTEEWYPEFCRNN